MEMTIDFPGGARVDAHFGELRRAHRSAAPGWRPGVGPDAVRDLPVDDRDVRRHLRAGLLPAAGDPDGRHPPRPADADRPDDPPGERRPGHHRAARRVPGQVRRRGRSRRRAVRREEALRAPAGHPRGEHPRRPDRLAQTGVRSGVRASGRSIQNRAPPSAGFSTPVLPPWASTMARVIARPSPEVPEPRSRLGSTW